MGWYDTGQITIDTAAGTITIAGVAYDKNKVVVGIGTAWVANASPGEAIDMPDAHFYEIAAVPADGYLILRKAYAGSSVVSPANYTIMPSQSHIRDLTAAAAALISAYASVYNTVGAGKFGDGALGAPGISFVGDTNSGIARTADGTFVLVSNGVVVATIAPGGMALVGMTQVAALTASALATLNAGLVVTESTIGINSGSTSGRVRISGGTPNDGAVIVLGGSGDGSIPSTGLLAVGATTVLSWTTSGLSANVPIAISGAVTGLSGAHSFKGSFSLIANDAGTSMYTAAGIVNAAGESAANSSLWLRKDSTTSRSISAAGTLNASGADYAEYEKNNGLTFAKGDVAGFKADGTLTDLFAEAVRFGIKSTNPSYVGGDTWGAEAEVGARPAGPVFAVPDYAGAAAPVDIQAQPAEPVLILPASPVQQLGETAETFAAELQAAHAAALAQYPAALAAWQTLKDAYDLALAQHQSDMAAHADAVAAAQLAFDTVSLPAYQAELSAFEVRLEAARQLVDRIAYSGKVPVNVMGATPGDYLVAVAASDGGITAIPVADPTFAQYKLSIGRVNRILLDGRAEVAVIVH